MLITVDDAKDHLRLLTADHDERLETLVETASGIVLGYLKRDAAAWQTTDGEPANVPWDVQAAVKLVVAALFENPEALSSGPQPLSQPVKDLLHRLRDPALA